MSSRGKARREAANGINQIDYLTYLVTDLKVRDVRESHVLELQKQAIDGIYPCGGTYRDARTTVRISSSEHVPPESAFVPSHVREMLTVINGRSHPPLERAAYALWRLINRAGSGTADSQADPDLSIMIAYLQDLWLQQVSSATVTISEPLS